ncbi:hypothetical protein SAMN05421743_12128 [Thalassobacillus cyri]|uniref:Uncharacterized protein n=1 Tax=Thalassobacillus cyri TaxID=571932 RepID=A0A1H4H3H4_9BACI|nr:hypothetical protein [Thalassobacillus cyri]SEB15658.1 hypothetical protein SAMN05421743_12128 [Thalassobacillus cyri]
MDVTITSFTFSEDSQNVSNPSGKGNTLQLINPQNLFRPPFIPCTYSFSVTCGLIKIDPHKTHTVQFILESPEGDTPIKTDPINVPKNNNFDASLPDEANGFVFNLDFRNVPFKVKGEYKGKIIFNNELLGEYPLMFYPQENN